MRSERESGALRLLRVPLASFRREGPQLAASAYRTLTGPHEGAFDSERARFAGHHLLWGTKGVGSRSLPPTPFLDVVPLQGGPITHVEIGHSIADLVQLGEQVVAIGSDSWHLHYSLIGLSEQPPRLVGHYLFRDAQAKLEGFGSALALSSGTERWLAAAIAPRGTHAAETRLTLHWSPERDALEAGDTWSVAKAPYSPLDPADSEALLLDPTFSLLRIQAQLRVYRADHDSVTLTQSIALTP
jgi:hypothetical protein